MQRNRFGPLATCLSYVIILSSVPVSAGVNLYVSPAGNDGNTCSSSLPCRQIRRALELVDHGDTILVADGTYKGFTVSNMHGNQGNPITIKAQGSNATVVKTTDRPDNRDTIFITWSSYITIDGLRSFNANRAAIRVDESPHVTIRNCVLGNNGVWGIFTDFSDDLLIEDNETYGSVDEHGIYASNSGDRPVIRGNRVYNNRGNGIHVNGDISSGGDGIISGALIEGNIVYNNGRSGGSAINMDGVLDSTIRNNILYNNHATGIGMYQINGGDGPRNNKVYHNTVHQAQDGRYALMIWDSTGPIAVRNNILYHPNPARGGIVYLTSRDVAHTNSDYNVLDRVSPDDGGTVYSLEEWQAQGRERHSLSATPRALFVNAAGGNYHLAAASPAIDRGQTQRTVTRDFEGHPRPQGAASDLGADETGGGAPAPHIRVTPTSLAFGQVSVGSADDLTVTVRNTGGGTLTGSASTAAPFRLVGAASYSLAPNQTARITVRFSPTASGVASRFLTLTGGGGASVSLSGTGATALPVLTVTPTSLFFGTVSVGSTAKLSVTVRNSGGGTLTGSASTSAPFSVVGTASYSLAAHQTATIVVRFSPGVPGAASRKLSLTGAAGASVDLGGTGAGPSVGEPVAWKSTEGVAVSGNNLTKNVAIGWGNSGASSTKALMAGAGFVEHTIRETKTSRMLGLSNGNSNNRGDDIDFSLYSTADGKLRVYEKGVLRGTFGPYNSGDKLRVAVVGGVVRYYRNASLLYSSKTAPQLPPRRRLGPLQSGGHAPACGHLRELGRVQRRSGSVDGRGRGVGLRQQPDQECRDRLGQRRRHLHEVPACGRRLRRAHRARDEHVPHARPQQRKFQQDLGGHRLRPLRDGRRQAARLREGSASRDLRILQLRRQAARRRRGGCRPLLPKLFASLLEPEASHLSPHRGHGPLQSGGHAGPGGHVPELELGLQPAGGLEERGRGHGIDAQPQQGRARRLG